MSETGASPPVLERHGARATIRLNRPKHLNRLQADDLDVLVEAVRGDRGRCDCSRSGAYRHRPRFQRRLRSQFGCRTRHQRGGTTKRRIRFRGCRQPARGYRHSHHLPAQWRGLWRLDRPCARLRFPYRRRHCEMFMPAARLGLHYYKSGIARYVTRLGLDNAKRLFLTAEKIGATEMLRIGYLTSIGSRRGAGRRSRPAWQRSCRQCTDRHARHEADHQRDRARQTR